MKKILIVDDQYGIRLLLSEVFKKEGYKTFIAAEGEEALDIVGKNTINIVILDMKLPKMNGVEILKRIRQIDMNIKVIMMTAYGEIGNVNKAKEYGIIELLCKPFDINYLKAIVKNIIEIDDVTFEEGEKVAELCYNQKI